MSGAAATPLLNAVVLLASIVSRSNLGLPNPTAGDLVEIWYPTFGGEQVLAALGVMLSAGWVEVLHWEPCSYRATQDGRAALATVMAHASRDKVTLQ